MKILNLKINNILSIEDAEINFEDNGLVLVEGWNHDVGRANGAGKTAIFNALSFALYDKVPRKITASEILRRGTSRGFASVDVIVGDSKWTVVRSRPKGVRFFKDGIEHNLTQEEWEDKLRLSYNQFLISVYCAQRGDNRFLQLNDSDKKNFLLQLLNLDKFQDLRKASEDVIKTINTDIADLNLKTSTIKSKIDAYTESLVDVDEITSVISTLKTDIESYDERIKVLQLVTKPDLSNYIKLEQQVNQKQQGFAAARASRGMLHSQYKKTSALLVDFNLSPVCKTCGSDVDISDAKRHHDDEQAVAMVALKELKEQIDAQDVILAKEQEVLNFAQKIAAKKKKELEEFDNAKAAIAELKSVGQNKQFKLQDCVVKLEKNSELLSKVEHLSAMQKTHEENHSRKVKDLEFYKILSAIYSPTGAQAYILDSIIDSFNEAVSNYIHLVWPTATYSINSFKENSKGDVTAKFSESLMIDSKDVSVGSLSGGELRAISLCVDFAVMDVMQNNFGIKTNPTILDEPFEGLDSVGKEIVIGLLEKIANDRQILVVDHSSEAKAMFSKVISVELRNKISTIKVDF